MKIAAWLRYQLERWMLRGSPAMLAIFLLLLVAITTVGALIAYFVPGHHFHSIGGAFWWAVLRISDPGYLSDEIPDLKIRALSVVLSVLGIAVTVGGIVALVTGKMNRTLAHLAEATTPVPFSNHIVLLGWTDRTPRLLQQLLRVSSGKIVVLIEKVESEEMRRLARALPTRGDQERVVLRRGKSYRKEDLGRAACATARVVILAATAASTTGDAEGGPRSLKTLLALRTVFSSVHSPTPLVIVEVLERNMIRLVEAMLPEVSVLHSDRLVSRALRIGLQAPAMLSVAPHIVRPHEGWRWELRAPGSQVGRTLGQVHAEVSGARLVGVTSVEGERPYLNTHADHSIGTGNQLVYLHAHKGTELGGERVDEEQLGLLLRLSEKRVLVLGWSEIVPDLIAELSLEERGRYSVDVVSPVRASLRKRILAPLQVLDRVKVQHFGGNPALLDSVEEVDVSNYDRFVVLSDRIGSPEAADARTLAIVLELDRQRKRFKPGAYVTAELLEPEDLDILQNVDAVVTPILVADVLSSLAGSPESHVSLQQLMTIQRTFVSRVIDLPDGCGWEEEALSAALRQRDLALLTVLGPTARRTNHRLIVAEPVALPLAPE
jgi:hypothetical protein